MSNPIATIHAEQVQAVAKRYEVRGYQVQIEPSSEDYPFDLGNYRPDLIARKADENLVIEVKMNSRNLTVSGYREIAEEVAGHENWRFLLVTCDDLPDDGLPAIIGELVTPEVIAQRVDRAEELFGAGDAEASFLVAWSALEGLLRLRARQSLIPVERIPFSSLAKHLYSQGELSAEELDDVLATTGTRNRLMHGFRAPDVRIDAEKLKNLIQRILVESFPAVALQN